MDNDSNVVLHLVLLKNYGPHYVQMLPKNCDKCMVYILSTLLQVQSIVGQIMHCYVTEIVQNVLSTRVGHSNLVRV